MQHCSSTRSRATLLTTQVVSDTFQVLFQQVGAVCARALPNLDQCTRTATPLRMQAHAALLLCCCWRAIVLKAEIQFRARVGCCNHCQNCLCWATRLSFCLVLLLQNFERRVSVQQGASESGWQRSTASSSSNNRQSSSSRRLIMLAGVVKVALQAAATGGNAVITVYFPCKISKSSSEYAQSSGTNENFPYFNNAAQILFCFLSGGAPALAAAKPTVNKQISIQQQHQAPCTR
jgi:hypothetical protein